MASALTRTPAETSRSRSTMMQQPLRPSFGIFPQRDARKSLELYGPPRRPMSSPVSTTPVTRLPLADMPDSDAKESDVSGTDLAFLRSSTPPSTAPALESATEMQLDDKETGGLPALREPSQTRLTTPTPQPSDEMPKFFASWSASQTTSILDLYISGHWSSTEDALNAPVMGKGLIAPLPTVHGTALRMDPTSVPAKRARASQSPLRTSNLDERATSSRASSISQVESWRQSVVFDSEEQEQADRRIKRCKLESDLTDYYDSTNSPTGEVFDESALSFPPGFGFRIERCDEAWVDGDLCPESAEERARELGIKNKLVLHDYVFEPTEEVFGDFENFVGEIERRGASRNGVVKIVLPKEHKVKVSAGIGPVHACLREDYKEPPNPRGRSSYSAPKIPKRRISVDNSMRVYNQILRPVPTQAHKVFEIRSVEQHNGDPHDWANVPDYTQRPRPYTEKQFLELATYSSPKNKVLYSTDNSASPFLRQFFSLPDFGVQKLSGNVVAKTKEVIEGIHTPYLYFARKHTCFAMHIEDFGAHSVNYMHAGSPKRWIVVKPSDAHLVEALLSEQADGSTQTISCSQFVRHKSVFIPTATLRERGIRYTEISQREGEMVITFPYAYHQGWNTGRNCAEAIAWGNQHWREKWVGRYAACREECKVGEPISFTWKEDEEEETDMTV